MSNNYNHLTYYQEQLNRAIQLLEENPSKTNYTEEAKDTLSILAKTRPIYKKAYLTNELVLVGKLTSKNEIIFDLPKTSLYPMTKNLGRNSSIYLPGWITLINVDKIDETGEYIQSQREENLSYYDIANRDMFKELLSTVYYRGDNIDVSRCSTIGFMMGDCRNMEVVFYDQYKEV